MLGTSQSAPPIITVTNHGTHSPATWAGLMSQLVFPIAPTIDHDKRVLAESIQQRIVAALEPIAKHIQDRERALLVDDCNRFAIPLDGDRFLEAAEQSVFVITDYSPWGDHLRLNKVVVQFELRRELNEIQHIERMYYADMHPHLEAGRRYRRQYNGEK